MSFLHKMLHYQGEDSLMFSGKDLRKLLGPLVVEQFLTVLVGMVDTLMVAVLGEEAVSGVSLVDQVMLLMITIFSALSAGGAVICGNSIGAKKFNTANKAAEQLVLFVTALAIGVMLILYVAKSTIFSVVFGTITPEVAHNANVYFMIVVASIPFIALYDCGAAIFRVMGNSAVSMKTSLLMNGLNIVGNAIFIFGLHYGVEGVAIPTFFSRAIAAIVIIMLLRRDDYLVHLRKDMSFRPDWEMIKRTMFIGVPNGMENGVFQLGKLLILSLVSTYGTASIAANAVGNNIALLQIMPGMAVGVGVMTVVSQCVGAGAYEQAKYYTRRLTLIGNFLVMGMVAFTFVLLPQFLSLYHLSEETMHLATMIIVIHGICASFLWSLSFILPNTLRASGDVRFVLIASLVSMWVFRIGFSYVFDAFTALGVVGVWIAMDIDWLCRIACYVWRYRQGAWMKKRV